MIDHGIHVNHRQRSTASRPRGYGAMLKIDSRNAIPEDEFEITFVRSSGPGGQNVNKVATKAQLRWNPHRNQTLREDVRRRFLERYESRLTGEGDLLVTSQRYRSQERNLEDCYEKLVEMIRQVLAPPVPRRPTRPTKGSIQRRLETKKRTSQRKADRRGPKE